MDFGKAFSYVFEDPEWIQKVGLGGIITLVPIVNLAASGYAVEVAQRVIRSDPHPLPAWDDFGAKWVKGLLYAIIGFVYALPVILLSCIINIAQAAIVGPNAPSSGAGTTASTAAGIVAACLGCVSLIYSLVLLFVLPAAFGNYAARNELGAAFRFGEVFALLQKNPSAYLIVLVLEIVAGLVAALGVVACVIGVFFTAFFAQLVIGHAIGQAYRESSASLGLV